jgi:iron complex transport system substrate-binding protein
VHGATSAEIDRSVKGLVEQGLAVYEVDAAGLEACRPSVILTQDQCEVCAVSLRDVEQAVCTWTGSAAAVVSLRPHTMAGVMGDIRKVANAIGRPEAGEDLTATMTARLKSLAQSTEDEAAPRLAFIEWIEPPMSGGHWMPELIAAAGGIDLLGHRGENSPWITWEQVAVADPDVILVAPCGYDIATTLREMQTLSEGAVWRSLRAVRDGHVYAADGNAYFNRPGPRLVESAEILAEILHPETCRFGHEGTGYVRWSG